MDGMKDFPPEFTRPFVISFNYFMSCNIGFFDDNVPFWRKYWRFVIMTVIVLLNFISMLMYMTDILGSQMNISDIAFMATACLFGLQSILKSIVLLPKKENIEDLIRGLAKMWKIDDDLSDAQMKDKNRRLKQLNITLTVFYWASTTAVFLNLVPQLIHTVSWKIRGVDFDFILPFGYVYPFDPVRNWGRYLLVYLSQYYAIVRLINYYLGVHCLVITLCSQLSTEFAILRADIKYVIPMPNKNKVTQEPNVDKDIIPMIKNHQELIKLAQFMNYIFNQIVFIDMCFVAVILCFTAISLSVSRDAMDKITNISSILSLLSLVYLFCYYCEMLKVESAGIAESAYENPWYEGGTHYQKVIRLIIMRAQRPCYLTFLNYAPISLNTLTKIVSSTWSYFSLAMTMCGENNNQFSKKYEKAQ